MASYTSRLKRRAAAAGLTAGLALLTTGCHDLVPPQNVFCDDYPYARPCVPGSGPSPTVPTIPRPPTTTSTTAQDTTPPSAPQDLVATPGDRQVQLDWSASSDQGGSGLAGYRVHRSNGDGTFSVIGTTAGTTFTDTGLKPGKRHSYFVTAYDRAGNESAPSNTVVARAR